ncbi:FISUMP domain-containing protein [Aquimarina brevivitae]|uniref:Uncharacterized protein (TIGR02145 family) n=1 Tax=Aquimarina brevivitae TaxID=323412 RepID=A0A4Q7P0C1_9FLAO|nr:FISUMP domain-containing protein [Aquimarina brevivitae]RZS93236.1 uncharacterized protein (TIGR02145 family) [Aquimarina brevivitae]
MKTKFLKLVIYIFILTFLESCASDDSTPSIQQENLTVILNTPLNNSDNIDTSSSFNWSVNGSIDGVEITYDFYLGLNPNDLELIKENINEISFNYSKLLTNQNTYYWKVKATDANDRVSESPVFTFTTIANSGTFIDPRDNEEYRWIGIGDQIWMVDNLRFRTNDAAIALNNDESTVSLYGRFYFIEDALVSCPEGWHLPSNEEFNQLIEFVAIEREFGFFNYEALLKSVSGWVGNTGGNNYSGYNHLPTGIWNIQNQFGNTGEEGYQWTSTISSQGRYSIFGTTKDANSFFILDNLLVDGVNTQRHCVRCIKN